MLPQSLAPGLLSAFLPLLERDAALAQAVLLLTERDVPALQRLKRVEPLLLQQLMQASADHLGSRETALQLAEQMPLQAWGGLGLLLASASDGRELIADLHRYWPTVQCVDAVFEVHIGAEQVSLDFRPQQPWSLAELMLLEIQLYQLARLLGSLFGKAFKLEGVSYPDDRLGLPGDWRRLLGVTARVQGPCLGLQFASHWLDSAISSAAAETREQLRPSLEAELRRVREHGSFSQQVFRALSASESLRAPSIDRIAEELGCSAGALQQRLSAEGSDFDAVYQALRRERALDRLLVGDTDSAVLAEELGFADLHDFERQFRLWFQTTPTRLRSDAHAAGIDARSGEALCYEELPPAPQSCRTLMALRYMADASIDDMVGAVQSDPALSAKVIGVASSAFYGARRVRDLKDAIGRVLGLNELIRIATLLSAKQALKPLDCPSFDLLAFWTRALAVGQAAAELLDDAGSRAGREGVRLLGLFHELGLQVLAHRAGRKLDGLLRSLSDEVSERALRSAELRQLGTSRHIAGSILLAHWGLPPDIVRALRNMDHCILDPHADIEVDIRLIVLLSRLFRRRQAGLPVQQEAGDVIGLLVAANLPCPFSIDSLLGQLEEILESRQQQAEELLG